MSEVNELYVVGIPPDMPLAGFKNLFGRCGKVVSANLLEPRGSFCSCVGFIKYSTTMEAFRALQEFRNFQIGTYTMKAEYSKKSKNEMSIGSFDSSKIDYSELVKRSCEQAKKRSTERFSKRDNNEEISIPKPVGYPCATCQKLCHAACTSCKSVYYCGTSCQKEDWPRHKLECKGLQITGSPLSKVSIASISNSQESLDVVVDPVLINTLSSQLKACDLLSSNGSVEPVVNSPEVPFPVRIGDNQQVQLLDLQPSGVIHCMVPIEEELSRKLDPLNDYYCSGNGQSPSFVERGCFYACMFSGDKKWYRAFVVDITEAGSSCSVWYIDFGNCEDVLVSNLKILTPEFASIPMHSIRCKLHGCDGISGSSIKDFISQVLSDPLVDIKVVKITAAIVHVQMFQVASGQVALINDLVKAKYQKSSLEKLPNSAKIEAPEALESSESIGSEKCASKVSSTSGNIVNGNVKQQTGITDDIPTIKHALTQINNNELLPLRSGAGDGKHNISSNVASIHSPKGSSKLWSVFKKIRTKACESCIPSKLQPFVIPRGKFEAIITHVESIEEIYLSVHHEHEQLGKLQSELKTTSLQNLDLQPNMLGTYCAYLDDSTNTWHRAKIARQIGSNEVELSLVDLGCHRITLSSRLCKLPAPIKFWVARKAFPCKLYGCMPCGASYNAECLNLLKQCVNEKVVAEVNDSSDGIYLVTIFMDDTVTVNWCINELRHDFAIEPSLPVKHEVAGKSSLQERPMSIKQEDIDTNAEKNSEGFNAIKHTIDQSNSFSVTSPTITLAPTLSSKALPVIGEEIAIIITNVVNPGKFTFQIVSDDLTDFGKFCMGLSKHYSSNNDGKVSNLQKGELYAAKYHVDKMWYRAKAVDSEPDDGTYKLLFMDFGNIENVRIDDIRTLHEIFVNVPIQGIDGGLFQCGPIGDEWSANAVSVMQSYLNQNLVGKVHGYTEDGGTLVDVVATAEGHLLTDLLIALEYARKPFDQSCMAAGPNQENVEVVKQNELDVELERKKPCHEVPSERNNANIPSNEAESTYREITPSSPSIGVMLDALVVYATSPSEMYLQVIADDLREMLTKLSELDEGEAQLLEQDCFDVGSICLACASDKRLYRARITEAHDNGTCTVLFMDYGNSEVVPCVNMKKISTDLCKINSQAVKCALQACRPVDSEWSEDCLHVVKCVIEQQVKAIFAEQDNTGCYQVKIFLEDETCVNEYLVQQAFAKKDDDPEKKDNAENISAESPISNAGDAARNVPSGTNAFFQVKLTLVKQPSIDGSPESEIAKMLQQFLGRPVNARLIQEENEQPQNLTLVVPNIFSQLTGEN